MNIPKYDKYACWYLVNGYKCKHRSCNFSHDPYVIFEHRTKLDLDKCRYGDECPTKCNKIHNKKELFYACYNETRKRKRAERDIEEKEKNIEEKEKNIEEREKNIEEREKNIEEREKKIDNVKLKYALF